MNSVEPVRLHYKPKRIRILFVGESPAAGGTFFYNADSNIYRYTQEAFSTAYDEQCGQGKEFLAFFGKIGCYLDDLCLHQINHLESKRRKEARYRAISNLSARITENRPRNIVVIMKGICREVTLAVKRTGLPIPLSILPFPAQSFQRKYVTELVELLNRFRAEKVIP